jgi:hypothetical protein
MANSPRGPSCKACDRSYAMKDIGDLANTEVSSRRRRGWVSPDFQIPIRPGSRVEDSRRCPVDRFDEFLFRQIFPQRCHILICSVGQNVRDKMDRVIDRFGR